MAVFFDRAAMTVSGTPGTGPITLGSAYYKHQTFAAAGVTNGVQVAYAIEDGANWETGLGTYSSTGPTLTRTTIRYSSNANAAINVSSNAVVYSTFTAEDIPGGSTLAVSAGGTGATSITGLVKGNGSSAFTAAVAGTDYVAVGGALGTPSSGNLSNCTGVSGTRTLLNTLTAASSSSLSDTTSITATYNYYSLLFDAILPSTSSQAQLQVRVGGAYQSSNYSGVCHAIVGTAATSSAYSTQINLTTGTVYNSAEGMHGELIFVNPSATSGNRVIYGCLRSQQDASTHVTTFPRGYYTGAGAITGFQFTCGTITSGTIKIYGWN